MHNEDVTTFFLGGSCHAIPQSVLALGLYYNIISVGNIKSAKVYNFCYSAKLPLSVLPLNWYHWKQYNILFAYKNLFARYIVRDFFLGIGYTGAIY